MMQLKTAAWSTCWLVAAGLALAACCSQPLPNNNTSNNSSTNNNTSGTGNACLMCKAVMQSDGTPEGTRRILEICQGIQAKPEECQGCAEFDAICDTDYTMESDRAQGS